MKKLSIFITAGYPSIENTIEQILMLQEKGVDFIEVGIPFSDPMADGPVIQETSNIAIQNGMNLTLLFSLLEKHKSEIKIPLVMMGYFNPIFLFGVERFLENCISCNIRQLIIPDISMEVYERSYRHIFERYGVSLCFLVTPLSSNERILKAAKLSEKGFVYLVSQNTITGDGNTSTANHEKRYMEIKELCDSTPVMLGFGIKNREDVERACQTCDGAIIGTAYLKALGQNQGAAFVSDILKPTLQTH